MNAKSKNINTYMRQKVLILTKIISTRTQKSFKALSLYHFQSHLVARLNVPILEVC